MEKIKLACAVLCEGKYDKIKLSSVIDGTIITTDGFSIFNNSEKKALLKKLCAARGVVIITDSDKAGFFIRSKLRGMLPADRVRHLYIPEIAGKEKRKASPSKDGLLGVEGMSAQTLKEIITRANLDESLGNAEKKDCSEAPKKYALKADLYELGLSGGSESSARRIKLCEKLGFPKSLGTNANALLAALEIFSIGLDELAETVSECEFEESEML